MIKTTCITIAVLLVISSLSVPVHAQTDIITWTSWNATGELLAVAQVDENQSQIQVVSNAQNVIEKIRVSFRISSISWSKTGTYLAGRYSFNDPMHIGRDLFIWSLASGALSTHDELDATVLDTNIYWSPAQDWLASPKVSTVDIWDAQSSNIVKTLQIPDHTRADVLIGL
ncbi:MAG: hypothetical protein MUE40_21525, partial [Anaerolineae bacterium]|nr:hypothetical protein [Anaerolineae bacterium]